MKTQPLKGMRDLLPREQALRDYIQGQILATYRAAGFQRISTPILEDMENLRRQKSVHRKFDLCKLLIGQELQFINHIFGQFSQGGFVGHQVALHQPQFVDKPQPGAGVVEHHQHELFVVKVHGHPSLSGRR